MIESWLFLNSNIRIFISVIFRLRRAVAFDSRLENPWLNLNQLILCLGIILFSFFLFLRPRDMIGIVLKGLKPLFDFTISTWHNLCFIAIGPFMIIFDSAVIVIQDTSPYSGRLYIYVSSRWCLLIRKGVLLLIVIFVLVILGAIYFFEREPARVSSIYSSNYYKLYNVDKKGSSIICSWEASNC
jgi:hypothetical protein